MKDETFDDKVARFSLAAKEGHHQALHHGKAPICPNEKSFKSVIYHLDCAGWDVVKRIETNKTQSED